MSVDHNIWNYVYYLAYLKNKDLIDETGIETYVREHVANASLEWIPSRTSHFLEAQGKTGPGRMQKLSRASTPNQELK